MDQPQILEPKLTRGQRLRKRLSQLTIQPLGSVFGKNFNAAQKPPSTSARKANEGSVRGLDLPLPTKQLDTSVDKTFLDRIVPKSQPQIALPGLARIKVVLKRRVNEARGRLLERDSASTRSAKSLNVLENEAEHHNTKEILQAQHSVTGEMPVEDAKSGASDVDVKSEPAQPPLAVEHAALEPPPSTASVWNESDDDISEEQIEAEWNRLESRLKLLRLAQVEMEDDGNCQFRAISMQLYGTQNFHHEIRNAICDLMCQRSAYFGVYFENHECFMEFIDEMRMNGTWGNELTLKAGAEFFRTCIHIVTSSSTNWYLSYAPEVPNADVDAGKQKQIFLSYISPVHYNCLALLPPKSKTRKIDDANFE